MNPFMHVASALEPARGPGLTLPEQAEAGILALKVGFGIHVDMRNGSTDSVHAKVVLLMTAFAPALDAIPIPLLAACIEVLDTDTGAVGREWLDLRKVWKRGWEDNFKDSIHAHTFSLKADLLRAWISFAANRQNGVGGGVDLPSCERRFDVSTK